MHRDDGRSIPQFKIAKLDTLNTTTARLHTCLRRICNPQKFIRCVVQRSNRRFGITDAHDVYLPCQQRLRQCRRETTRISGQRGCAAESRDNGRLFYDQRNDEITLVHNKIGGDGHRQPENTDDILDHRVCRKSGNYLMAGAQTARIVAG